MCFEIAKKLVATIEVTSYDLSADDLRRYIQIPKCYEFVALPLAHVDSLPNHLEILVLKNN